MLLAVGVIGITSLLALVFLKKRLSGVKKTLVDPAEKVRLTLIEREVSFMAILCRVARMFGFQWLVSRYPKVLPSPKVYTPSGKLQLW